MRVAVLRFPGTWSERDFQHAIGTVLGIPTDVLWHEDALSFAGFDAVIVPGGFAYGDYLRAGAIARLSPAMAALRRFAASGGLVLGSCNGFQILCEAGLLPGARLRNDHLEYRCEWVHVRVDSDGSPWTAGLRGRVLRMPISHGEGNYYADPETHRRLVADDRVVFRYCDADGNVTRDANPNGSLDGIAGIRDERGNVLGLMPHPERACEAILGGEDGLLVLRALETRLARPLLSAVSDT